MRAGAVSLAHFYMPKAYRDSFVQSTDIYDPTGYERRLYNASLLYEGKEPKELFPLWSIWIDPSEADEAQLCCKRTSKITLNRMSCSL